MKYSNLIDRFEHALFATNYTGYESATQNAKTDYIFNYDSCFEDWFDYLITRFVEEVESDREYAIENNLDDVIELVDEDELRKEIQNCPEFVNDMRAEYEDLLEIYSDYFDDEEDEE